MALMLSTAMDDAQPPARNPRNPRRRWRVAAAMAAAQLLMAGLTLLMLLLGPGTDPRLRPDPDRPGGPAVPVSPSPLSAAPDAAARPAISFDEPSALPTSPAGW